MRKTSLVVAVLCYMVTNSLGIEPQQVETEEERRVFKHGFQVEALKAIVSQYSLKYEFLIKQRHGIVLEGAYKSSSSGDGRWLGCSYRRHKKGRMEGGFWGFFVNYKEYDDEYKEEINGKKHTYPYTMTAWSFGPNIGQRWVLGSGLSFVWRFGFGVPLATLEWKEGRPEENRRLLEGLFKFFQGLDGELSIGYCF
jgi:hypothetical protein